MALPRICAAFALAVALAPAVGAQVTSNLVRPQGRFTVTLPDGTLLHNATNQLMVFVRSGADQGPVRSAITAGGGQVIGEVTSLRMLQVQLSDTTRAGALMTRLKSLSGVLHVGVNLFLEDLAGECRDTTPYVPADHVPPSPASAGDVIMIVVDDFARPNTVPAANVAEHGDIVAAVAVDAGGRNASGSPIFEVGRNLIELQDGTDFATTAELIEAEVARHPGKRVVINYSGGPDQCDAGAFPALDGRNEADRAAARADCIAADREFYASFNQGVMPRLRELTGDRVVWVNAAANVDVSLENASAISSCDFVPVGGMDGNRLAAFTEVSAAIPVYQQACNVAPRSLPGAMDSGNSFAAPFVAGQFAANWAAHPNMNGCTVGNLVTSLPPVGPGETGAVFDGTMIATIAVAAPPGVPSVPMPVGTLTCGAVTLNPGAITGTVGQTVRVTATAAAGDNPNFEFQSSNPDVATVDRASDAVTIRRTGVATISAKRPGSTCSGEASVVVPSEIYRGTFTMNLTTFADTPGWSPDPLPVTGTVPSSPIALAVGPSLTVAGNFTGALTIGPGTITVTAPPSTCTSCEIPITVPGTTMSETLPTSTGNISGISDQRLIEIPMPGLPAMTGTVSVLGPTVQLTLNWTYETSVAGGRIRMTLNANLTRQ